MCRRWAALRAMGVGLILAASVSLGAAETVGMPPLPDDVAQQVPAIGRIGIDRFAAGQGCTGTLIAPDLVLTAGHCASASGTSDRVFFAGWSSTGALAERGTIREIRHPSYVGAPNHRPANDIALIVLDAPILSVPPIPLAKAHPSQIYGTQVALMGYHAGLPDRISGQQDCPVNRFATGLLRIDCLVMSGNSGGPVLRQTAQGAWEIIGVVSSRYYAGAVAVELPDWLWEQLDAHTAR